jgi:uncharacterized membrane protein YqjE
MNKYHFECREFGVSDQGIHLLRSGFNYETIEFNNLESLTIERGKELNNWPLVLSIGIAFLSFALYYLMRLYDVFFDPENRVTSIFVEEILVPIFPLLLGAYCIYSSLKNGIVMRTRTVQDKTNKFTLREFEKAVNYCHSKIFSRKNYQRRLD